MKKKLIAALTAGAMAAMSLGMGASAEVQDVSLTVWGAEEDQAMLQEMINSFEEQYGEYANFTIRVSGYAVKFIDLTREQQLDVISRTCHDRM